MGSSQQILSSLGAAVAPGPLPTDLADLELWLPVSAISQADDSDIVTWNDQSGNARNASGTVARPKYRTTGGPSGGSGARVALTFDGNDRYFTLPNFMTGFTSGEVFTVCQLAADPPSTTGNSGPIIGDWGSNASSSLFPYNVDSSIYEGFGTTVRKDATKNPDTSMTTWFVYNVRSALAAFQWNINGATSGNDFFSTVTNTVGFGTAPKIGFSAPASVRPQGNLVEVIFYSRVLDQATERGPVVNTYLNNTYGFALPES